MTAPNHIVGGFTFTDERPISLESSTTVLEGREQRKQVGEPIKQQPLIL